MNLALLSHLKHHRGEWLDAHSLARSLELSLRLLDRELEGLAEAGYRIERDAEDGVRLVGTPDGLVAQEIELDLGTEVIGRRVIVWPTLTSTNDEAWRRIRARGRADVDPDGLDGLVIIAEQQTAGRGRLGRSWASPIGGLWMSVIIRTPLAERRQSMFTVAAAVAVVQAIRDATRLLARIRWPNDVLIDGRKVAGVLAEAESDFPDLCVLGIGVNVNVPAESLPKPVRTQATSLSAELGRSVCCIEFARSLLRHLDTWHARIHRGDNASLNSAWRELAASLGQRTVVHAGGKRFEGVVVELDLIEGVSLRLDRGQVRTFRSEEVSLVEVLHG
jgi:BirA family biotin operon repressor/biotin-[acetyl-CoA-carboxylase] ligase